ncbi:thiamine pyrophosphate-binding protein [Salirhabdus salicampi]|uniref:thiamine pyrophosphate-binding protein n=1 Tax=Salirhabdus salicampi TaxID=476102 RepID=UPI0020C256A3|nr:thiamine pyrophosphate-binding protein [Salirhabdus salicampi]MCP8615665.1 thiamine pyrophosphate-binding protein [Salirhabdus salicampi]
MNLGEAIIKKISDSGIDVAFGIPGGGTSNDLLYYMDKYDVNFVLTQNETTAAIMASVVGEVTKKPGIVVADLGPGALQLTTGLAYALLDRSPMIAITDRYGHNQVDYALRQKIWHNDVFKPVTKLSGTISKQNWNHMLNRGYRVATTPNYGSVHFDIPNDIIREDVEIPIEVDFPDNDFRLTADDRHVTQAVNLIEKANYPVIIVGAGINVGNGEQYEKLKSFVYEWGIPVFKTSKSKGTFPDSDDYSLGVFMGGKLESKVLDKCDLIVAIGLDPVELLPKKWEYPHDIVSISSVPNNEEMYTTNTEVVGDIAFSLDLINDQMHTSSNKWTKRDILEYRDFVLEKLHTNVDGLTPNDVVFISQEILPEDTIMTADVGASKLIVAQLWKAEYPHSFFMSNGLATMGFALPAAMALQHIYPNRTVASLTGDGGFLMRAQEIASAVQFKWPVIQIIFSDGRLSLMDVKQRTKGYDKEVGNEFVAPNYIKLAESYGANGWSVSSKDELRDALKQALSSTNGMPNIIEAKINPEAYHGQFKAIRDL